MENEGPLVIGESQGQYRIVVNKEDKQFNEWVYKQLKNRMIVADPDNKKCFNCSEDPKYTLKFGKGLSTIKIKLCEECAKNLKNMLDKEFGSTFWTFLNKKFFK